MFLGVFLLYSQLRWQNVFGIFWLFLGFRDILVIFGFQKYFGPFLDFRCILIIFLKF